MCVILFAPFRYNLCTLEDDNAHIFYSQRVITDPQPTMSQEFIDKLECTSPKNSRTSFGEWVCDDVIEWNEVVFGSTSRRARCPECERLRLYNGVSNS